MKIRNRRVLSAGRSRKDGDNERRKSHRRQVWGRCLWAERLEDRLVLAQFVDLGGLRFSADEFTVVGNSYSTSGEVQLGLTPGAGAVFRPLLNIETPDQGGLVSFTVGTADPQFTVTNATFESVIQGMSPIAIWATAASFTFDAGDLAGDGVALSAGAIPFTTIDGKFTLDRIRFAAADQIRLEGSLALTELVGLNVAVADSAYLSIDESGFNFSDFTATVENSFSVLGLSIDASDLDLAYSSNNGQFSIYGELELSTSDAAISGAAGSVGTQSMPGLIVGSGVVTQLSVSLTDAFKVFDLSLQPGSVTIEYDVAAQQFQGYGSAAVTLSSGDDSSPQASLGDADNPGLIIANNEGQSEVQQVSMIVDGLFELFGLPTRADEMTLAYVTTSDQYELTGKLTLPALLFVSATLGDSSGSPAIVIKNGEYQVPDLAINLSDIYFGAFVLDELTLTFQQDDHGVAFGVSFAIWLPAGITFTGNAGFDSNGVLNSIGGSYSGPGIPVGDTGVNITGISAEFQNFDHPADIIVSGSLSATYGPDELEIAGVKTALIKATGGFTASKDKLILDGSVYVGAYTPPGDTHTIGILAEGSGTLTLDWGNSDYRLDVSLGWYDDFFSLDATIDVSDGGNNLYVRAEADVNVPSGIPFIGGKTIAGVDFVLEWHKDRPNSESFAAAWVSVDLIFTSVDIGFKVDFDKSVSVIGNRQVHDIEQDSDQAPQVYHYYGSITIPPQDSPAGATNATISVDWPEAEGSQTVSITLPNGDKYDQSQFASTGGLISLINPAGQNSATSFVIHVEQSSDPFVGLATGVYEVALTSTHQFSSPPTFAAVVGYTKPVIDEPTLMPSVSSGVPVDMMGKVVSTLGPDARVTLFVDSDNQGYDGKILSSAANLPITVNSDGVWSLDETWNQSGLIPLPYYVYAVINDGTNTPVFSAYSAASIPTPALSGIVSDPYPGHNGGALSGFTVYLDLNNNGQFDAGSDPSTVTGATGFYSFYPPQLPANEPVHVGVVIPTGYELDPGSHNLVEITYNGQRPAVVNFGLDQLATISGNVYADFTAGEQPLAGWQVYLDANGNHQYDAGEVTTQTDAAGNYAFYNLNPNDVSVTYSVAIVLPSNYYQTAPTPIPPGTYTVTLTDKYQLAFDKDFGVLEFSTISGNVSGRRLEDGVLDGQLSALPGWIVQLIEGASIDVGGGGSGNYVADEDFTGGAAGSTTDSIDLSRVGDPAPEAVYQTFRHGRDFSYTAGGLTPGEAYTVRLHFAEPEYDQSGQRYVSASINGQLMLSDFDIANVASGASAAGGKDVAIIESFLAAADQDGKITIRFTALDGYDDALVSGIEIVRIVDTTTSDSSGNYTFGNLRAGVYSVRQFVPFQGLAINAGGGASGGYQTDRNFFIGVEHAGDGSDGRDLSNATSQAIDASGVADPAPQSVYQTNRYGEDFSYVLTGLSPHATYTLRMDFAEIFWGTPGQRIFNVAANGSQLLNNFDVYAEAGGNFKGLARSFDVTADASGTMTLKFTAVADYAMVSGIQIMAKPGVALNSGGGAAGDFLVDADFTGFTQTASTTDSIDASALGGDAAPQAVYQTNRYGTNFSYVVPNLAPGAAYRVRLHFAEFFWDEPGRRVFNVAINGQQVLSEYDIFMEAGDGFEVANFEEFVVAADAMGKLTIQFTAITDNAQINGIEIAAGNWQLTSPPLLTDTVDGSTSTGNNFVFDQIAQINGRVYEDLDASATQDPGEFGRPGSTVYIDLNRNGQLDAAEPRAVTGPEGQYGFDGLANGAYQLRVAPEAGRRITAPAGGVHEVIVDSAAGPVIDKHFGSAIGMDLVLAMPRDADDWTIRRNGDRLEVIDSSLGVVSSEFLRDLHSVTITSAQDGPPNRLTLDLAAGAYFSLPGGIMFDAGVATPDALRLLLGEDNDSVSIDDQLAVINGGLMVRWVGVDSLSIDAGGGNDVVSMRGRSASGRIDLLGGLGDDVYALATRNSVLRISDSGGVDTIDFSRASAGVRLDLGQQEPQRIDDVDNVITLDGRFENAVGSAFADVLVGNEHDNLLRGGAGDDALIGGGGNDILVGNAGYDLLSGGRGRDLLIGGLDADVLQGDGADDVLIAGTTAFDHLDDGLLAFMAEWASERSYAERVQNLIDGSGNSSRANGNYFLSDGTVLNDIVPDTLIGGVGEDWFIVASNDWRLDDPMTVTFVDEPGLFGDFTDDGVVDGADFLAWQRGLGRTTGATRAQGDANADAAVDGVDLKIWRGTFADVLAANHAALEPAVAAASAPASTSIGPVIGAKAWLPSVSHSAWLVLSADRRHLTARDRFQGPPEVDDALALPSSFLNAFRNHAAVSVRAEAASASLVDDQSSAAIFDDLADRQIDDFDSVFAAVGAE